MSEQFVFPQFAFLLCNSGEGMTAMAPELKRGRRFSNLQPYRGSVRASGRGGEHQPMGFYAQESVPEEENLPFLVLAWKGQKALRRETGPARTFESCVRDAVEKLWGKASPLRWQL